MDAKAALKGPAKPRTGRAVHDQFIVVVIDDASSADAAANDLTRLIPLANSGAETSILIRCYQAPLTRCPTKPTQRSGRLIWRAHRRIRRWLIRRPRFALRYAVHLVFLPELPTQVHHRWLS